MSLPAAPTPRAYAEARLKTPATMLICKRCSTGTELRDSLKRVLKMLGRKRELRVVACACLDVCPKRGSAALLVHRTQPARCIVIDKTVVVDADFARRLLDERVGDAVPNEDRRLSAG